jgi:myo-inositol-1(or 4)-monophosphatase
MNNPLDTQLFDKALKFAAEAHSGTERREKQFPYIIHPMEAVAIVATITNDPELLAAAILHDTVEDTDVTIEDIRNEFGERVATLVDHETAQLPKDLPWRTRKQSQADLIASAPRDSKIVALGDKLSNLRAIANDYEQIGDELWKRFNAPNGKEDIAWYYRTLGNALSDLAGTPPYKEYQTLLDKTFGSERC